MRPDSVTHHAIGLVGHNVYPLRPPVLVNIRLLRRALLHADGFALQLFRRIALQGILRATRNTGPLYNLSLKAICALRFSVIYIPERIASNLRAFSAGIMPSKLLSTHTHFACSC